MNYPNQTQTGVAMASNSGIPEIPKQSELATQFNILNSQLDMLEKSLANLDSRLSPVLMPSKPCDEKGTAQQSVQTDLARLLQNYNNRLSSLIGAITDITIRIEI